MIDQLIESNVSILRMGLNVVRHLTDDQYANTKNAEVAAAGPHFRHIVDHYDCFLRGIDSGRIDYDDRARDAAVEKDPAHAAMAMTSVMERLRTLSLDSARLVQVKTDCGNENPLWVTSTAARELQFLVSHTVHHFSLVRIALVAWDVAIDPSFGVAPSTLRFRDKDSCAR